MVLWETTSPLPIQQNTAMALGYFDGVHMGHRTVIETAVADARAYQLDAAVFTFTLPSTGGFKGKTILQQAEKQRRIASLGVAHFCAPPFADICALSARAFVFDLLQTSYRVQRVYCGDNFTFGKNKEGDVALLKTLCAEAGITVTVVPMAHDAQGTVSSTRVRHLLGQGEMQHVNVMLGEPYCITLPVQHGKKIGRTLGFPTINQVYPDGMQLPQSGVYITKVTLQDGTQYIGATGIGSRPTVGGQGITCETFLVDFTGELYDASVTLTFYAYLKPTVRFETTDELRLYIESAAHSARAYFGK